MKKPLIGISGGTVEGNKYSFVNEDYVKSVYENGGIPIIIPLTKEKEIIKDQVALLDGLILTGGEDISPLYYNEEPMEKLGDIFIDRDYFDYKLVEFAKEKNIPILGICRGAQVLTSYHGGTLYQDLSYRDEKNIKHIQGASPQTEIHSVKIFDNTILSSIFNEEKITVNSFHHQAVKEAPSGFIISAMAPDGVVEAIESIEDEFVVGVQWHPERLQSKNEKMKNLFKYFIQKSNK